MLCIDSHCGSRFFCLASSLLIRVMAHFLSKPLDDELCLLVFEATLGKWSPSGDASGWYALLQLMDGIVFCAAFSLYWRWNDALTQMARTVIGNLPGGME